MKVSREWLSTYFDAPLPDARELSDLFTFYAFEVEGVEDVEGDTVIDVDVLPNRSSDCLCHRGIAREVSAIRNLPMARDPLRDTLPSWERSAVVRNYVDEPNLCPRYMTAVIRDVRVGPSPEWLKKRLEAIGQRSINNIVDITNYIMFELGQPMHAFDLNKFAKDNGIARIAVRAALEGEKITTLTGETYTLTTNNLVITDGVENLPIAIAGIKGGEKAEIDENTTDIVLEAAHFNYVNIRKTSRYLKLATDASLRFQNEPVVELVAFAMRDAITMVEDVAGGVLEGVDDVYAQRVTERVPVDVSLEYINAILGTSLTVEDVERILVRFGWEFSRDGTEFAITSPWERTDLSIPADFAEEIGRVYGLREIKAISLPPTTLTPKVSKTLYYGDKVRTFLTDRGYDEVYTYVFTNKGEVEVVNPLASDKAFLRTSLHSGIVHSLDLNEKHAPLLGIDAVKIFEIGPCFHRKGEDLTLAMGVRGVRQKQKKAEQELLNDVIQLEKHLGISLEKKVRDGVFEVSFNALLAMLPEPRAYDAPLEWNTSAQFTPWSTFPFVLRDIAVWVPKEVPAEEVLATIVAEAPDTLVRHDLFDTFEKEGRVSYAWHLVFQSKGKTLTDEEVNAIMDTITTALHARGWTVR